MDRTLTADDLARIDSYVGGASELHELLAAIEPLRETVTFVARIRARGGTHTELRYSAAPAPDGIDVTFEGRAPDLGDSARIGPLGPARVTARGMDRPAGISDEAWRELRAAAGIVIRALLMLET